jgi:D-amino-acid dehydrogenase
MEFASYDATLNRRRLALLTTGAAHYFDEPLAEPIEEEWFGWRPMTPDSVPIIDRTPTMQNVLVSFSCNCSDRLVAEVVRLLVGTLTSSATVARDAR